MPKSEYQKKTTSTLVSNAFSDHGKDNGKTMDALVDDTWKKVEAPPKKTPKKLVFGRVGKQTLLNKMLFSLLKKVHYFDRDDMEFDDVDMRPRNVFNEYGIVGIKSLLDAVRITAAQVCVNATKMELVLLVNFNEKYTKCLLLLVEVKTKCSYKEDSKNLLKQQYENFTAPSSERLDQTFGRLQKLVSQLELLEEKLSQEDANQNLLRSLSSEWNTHVVVWRNEANLDTISMDDLYKNLKVYKPEVKWMSSSSSSTHNMAFMSSSNNNTKSTNDQLILLMEFLLLALKEDILLGSTELQEIKTKKHKKSLRRSVPVETSAFIALVSCDGLGRYDWSDQSEEWPNYALMAFSSSSSNSEVFNDYTYSNSCLETVKLLKSQNDQLLKDLKKFELMVLGNFMTLTPDLSFTGLDEFVNKPIVENCKAKSSKEETKGNPQMDLHDQRVIDSGCSRYMTENMSYLTDYEEIDEGYVAFGGNPKGGKITRKDDYSRFTWVFFLATKDETSGILKSFITGIENLVDHKVKVIRCDNGTEFNNKEMNQFCEMKGILRQFSVAKTPQQNGVVERRNSILIKATRTMLADSKLPTTFWTEAVNTACYVQNRVLVVKPHNKTPYELFHGRTPTLSFMRPFGCLVIILNTIDYLGKFDGKADKGFFIGYSLNSKAFKVFNSRTKIVEENLHIRFSEITPNVVGSGPDWLFDIDELTKIINYEPIVAGTQSNGFTGTKASDNAGQARKETEPVKDYIFLPLWTADPSFSQDLKSSHNDGFKHSSDNEKKVDDDPRKENECNDLEKEDNVNSTNKVNNFSSTIIVAGINEDNELPFDPNMPVLEDVSIFNFLSNDEDDGTVADINNLDIAIQIEEEVYVCQPLGFEDLEFSDRVYKVEKALYGLHQAPSAWYETLSTYLLDNVFQRGKIDKTFFIKRHNDDILLKKDGTFISQDKYVAKILKKFGFTEVKTASTPMETQKPLLKDENDEEVDVHMYRSMIGSLMYLTSSRPDIMFAVCACARYQVNLKDSHLHDVKRIFRYLKGQPKLDLWYPKDSPFDLVVYIDSDYAGASLDRKSTTRDGKEIVITESPVKRDLQLADEEGINCLPNSTIFEQLALMGYENLLQKLTFYKPFIFPQWKFLMHTILQCLSPKTTAWNEFSSTMASAIICLAADQNFSFSKWIFDSMIRNLDNVFGKFLMYPRFLQIFLDHQLDGVTIHKRTFSAPSHTKKIFDNIRRIGKGFSGRVTPLFPTMVIQNQSELGEGSTMPIDPHHTTTILQPSSSQPQKIQKSRKPKRKDTQVSLVVLLTMLQMRLSIRSWVTYWVLDLEKTKTSQRNEIDSLKRRVKKLKQRNRSRTHKLKRLNKAGLTVRVESFGDEESLGGEEVFVAKQEIVSTAATTKTITPIEINLAQALKALKTSKPKANGIVFHEPGKSTTTPRISLQQSHDKGKGIMIEEPMKPKKKYQIRLDEEAALKLQAMFYEEERLARERAKKEQEANIALIET
uniref:Ribonuclease H-like domain-containing protein n=1 Tax=Tanacetum cinerariifolium TaxID=118510 RepID=A0A6L2JUG9_TANCI|nr:ribonuclease H-like domain-containing protein [Tanacetum cinerariifolium]